MTARNLTQAELDVLARLDITPEDLTGEHTMTDEKTRALIADAREALEAVTALHRRDPYIPEGKRPWCVCEEPWPCPTISAVEAALGGETDG